MLFGLKENNIYFLEMVDNIIGKGKIEYKFLIRFINSKLKESFKKEEKGEMVKGEDNYYTATMRAYTFLYYLYRMEKFKDKGKGGVKDMDRETWDIKDFNSKREAFDDYFEKNIAEYDVEWLEPDYEVQMTEVDIMQNIDSQFSGIISIKKHSKMYIDLLADMAADLIEDATPKMVKNQIRYLLNPNC